MLGYICIISLGIILVFGELLTACVTAASDEKLFYKKKAELHLAIKEYDKCVSFSELFSFPARVQLFMLSHG